MPYWRFVLFFVVLAIVISEILVVIQSYFLHGKITEDILFVGFFTPMIDAFIIALIVGLILAELKKTEAEQKRNEEALIEHKESLEQQIQERTRELNESEQRFRNFAESSSDWFWEMDSELRFSFFSSNMERLIGISPDKLLGKTREELLGTQYDIETWRDHLGALRDHEPFRDFTYHYQLDDGPTGWVRISGLPVFDSEGEFTGFRGTATDVSERRNLEAALNRAQKMEAIGQLSGGIAHDFNNLLGIIMGHLEIVMRTPDDKAKQERSLNIALESTKRGAELTQSLLKFSRKDALDVQTLDINGQVRDLETLMRKSLTSAIDIKFELAEDLWQTNINPGDFNDALINLAINAYDAMRDGGEIVIRTRNTELDESHAFMNSEAGPGPYICLELSDTGPGMTEEIVDQIFEPFFTTKERGKGTGLGLSMVYGFVRRSGGDISVSTEPGSGSSFLVYLPRTKSHVEIRNKNENIDEQEYHGEEVILVVDDEEDLLDVAEVHLQSLGYTTLRAVDGASALEILKNRSDIDLLVSDVIMPGGINGFELARQALDLDASLKVLMVSGIANRGVIGQTGINPADVMIATLLSDLLPKPYSRHDLAFHIRKTLEGESSKAESVAS